MIPEVARLLRDTHGALSVASRVLEMAARGGSVVEGDPAALDYWKRDGWADAVDVIAGQGTGQLARAVVQQVRDVRSARTIEGEYRILDDGEGATFPWQPFQRWLLRQRWGTFVLLGPKGKGKTTLAFRLAQAWQQQTGYPVDCVNVYADDTPEWATRRPSWWFVGLMKRITDTLDPPMPEPEEDEEGDADGELLSEKPGEWTVRRQKRRQRERYKRIIDAALEQFEKAEVPDGGGDALIRRFSGRILIVDEMSAFCGSSPSDPRRQLVRKIMHLARHLGWIILFIGQIAKHVPEDLLNCEAILVKEPLGDERDTDRDNPLVVRIWDDATDAFNALRNSPWRDLGDGVFRDLRSWAYAYSRSCNSSGYFGLMPFTYGDL